MTNRDGKPQDDISQALDSARNPDAQNPSIPVFPDMPGGDALVRGEASPVWSTLRFVLIRCGIMAERYPWQTTALLMLAIGCGTLCNYFGWTVLGGMAWYAAASED